MPFVENLLSIKGALPQNVRLVVVSKTKSAADIMQVYNAGQRIFGENRVQELVPKYTELPKDIQWHLIGHLQSNKVKHIAPFINLIQSVDSKDLLYEINKQAAKNNRVIDCLLQIYIAQEDTKYGFSFEEAQQLLNDPAILQLKNIRISGLMGMATNTDNIAQIRMEFRSLKQFFDKLKPISSENINFSMLSMGMSGDYQVAIEEGSTVIRVGSAIFRYR